jgi:hypothetical protein
VKALLTSIKSGPCALLLSVCTSFARFDGVDRLEIESKQVVAAVLRAPAFLSGLSDREASVFQAKVLELTEQRRE